MKSLKIGDIVLVKSSFMGQPPNMLGLVYETYQDFDYPAEKGVSIVLSNGKNLGGFSKMEQHTHLDYVCETEFEYEFTNAMQLDVDIRAGIFKKVFESLDPDVLLK
jgi:hypothetical protein